MPRTKREEHIRAAAIARTDLTVFGAVIAILEGGCVHGHNAAATRVIGICEKEMQRQLKIYDRNEAAAAK